MRQRVCKLIFDERSTLDKPFTQEIEVWAMVEPAKETVTNGEQDAEQPVAKVEKQASSSPSKTADKSQSKPAASDEEAVAAKTNSAEKRQKTSEF